MNNASENGSDFVRDLGDAVRKNPVSAALIGMGVLWLFSGSNSVARAAEFVRSPDLDRIPDAARGALEGVRSALRSSTDAMGERVASVTGAMREGAADTLDSAAHYGRQYADSASEYMSSIPGTGSNVFDTVSSNLSRMFKAQPLALGAVGIAIGVGIAAALPATLLEAEYLGEASDATKAKAADFASEQAGRVSNVAENVLEAVTEEAQRQGLTPEKAKSAAEEISAKIGRVAGAAGKGISDRTGLTKP
jgi:hypothetical protein